MRPASAIELDRASNGQLEAKGVSVRFEGILALDTRRPHAPAGRNSWADRAERRRQDYADQCDHGFQAPDRRPHHARRRRDQRVAAVSHRSPTALRAHSRQCGLFRDLTVLENAELAAVGVGLESRVGARTRLGNARAARTHRPGDAAGGRTAIRRRATGRYRARTRHAAEISASRRARRRNERKGSGSAQPRR